MKMKNGISFSKEILHIDAEQEVAKIVDRLRFFMKNKVRRRGMVVGLSGGIDSSLVCALGVRAFSPKRVFGLHMPERHSSDETLSMSRMVADQFKIESAHEDITGVLEALKFYKRYDDAVRSVIPEYGEGWKSKIVTMDNAVNRGFSLFSVVAKTPNGELIKKRLPLNAYLEILALTNFKQRTRKMLEYYYADLLHYAVAGTPNRLEYDQGFFVKQGDGAADIKPIAHLYKTQVYQLAEYLGVPENIRMRPSTTDTYSLSQGQDEFYFTLPYKQMDLCLYAKNNGIQPDLVSEATGLTREQVNFIFHDIEKKRSTTRYLHLKPLLIEDVPEVCC
jgi:NAD+ synthase